MCDNQKVKIKHKYYKIYNILLYGNNRMKNLRFSYAIFIVGSGFYFLVRV